MSPDQRWAKGVFLAFQYPVEVPVATMTFLRTALKAQRKARGQSEYSTPLFFSRGSACCLTSLNIPHDMLRRGVNVGFLLVGEKKRNEILQMALFEPSLCILDEMDFRLTSMRCGWPPTASTRCVRPTAPWW